MENLTMPQKILLIILGMIVVIILIVYVFTKENSTAYFEDEFENKAINIVQENKPQNNIIVHIAGHVVNEGIVELPEEARLNDAIEAAGGLTAEADLNQVNLASKLKDGQKVYIPSKDELMDIEKIELSKTDENYNNGGKVNINTATQSELETISGIGASTALKIINYRKENGSFTSVEDIKNVPGIGESKFESIKDFITVN